MERGPFLLQMRPDQLYGPLRLLFKVPKALPPAVKTSGREVNHSPKSSVEVRIELSCNSTPPYGLMWCTETALLSSSNISV
jgi:hypothetical protein